MAPPSYAALGKQAKDIFGSGYHFGLWKLNCKTTTSAGLELTTTGQSAQESGKVSGSLETKYNIKKYGLTITEKWNTDNTLNTEIAFKDIAPNVKLSIEGVFAPQTDTKTGKIKIGYGQDCFQLDGDVNIDLAGPLINFAAVLGHGNFLAGYQTAFDSQESKVTTNNFALGYKGASYVIHTNVNNGEDINGSIFFKRNEKMDCALQLSYSTTSEETKFGFGTAYKLDSDAVIRAKVNNASQLGLGYQQRLRDGINLTLSTLIDGQNLSSGKHKIGISLELQA